MGVKSMVRPAVWAAMALGVLASLGNTDAAAAPKLEAPTLVNLGDIQRQPKVQAELELKNTGDARLTINRAMSSCTCTVPADVHDKRIEAGQVLRLPVTINTEKLRNGSVDLVIFSDDPADPKHVVRITLNVVDRYRLDPPRPVLRKRTNEPATASVVIYNTGAELFQITGIESQAAWLRPRMQRLDPRKFVVVLDVDATLNSGELSSVVAHTNNPNVGDISIPVATMVEADVTFTPKMLVLNPTASSVTPFTIQLRDGMTIESVEPASDQLSLTMERRSDTEIGGACRWRADAPAVSGEPVTRSAIRVKVLGVDQPFELRVLIINKK